MIILIITYTGQGFFLYLTFKNVLIVMNFKTYLDTGCFIPVSSSSSWPTALTLRLNLVTDSGTELMGTAKLTFPFSPEVNRRHFSLYKSVFNFWANSKKSSSLYLEKNLIKKNTIKVL